MEPVTVVMGVGTHRGRRLRSAFGHDGLRDGWWMISQR